MLQADPPPKAVKVTMSRRVPLVGEELIAYEEEQTRLKKEEALKASLVKEEESKASLGPDNNLSGDLMVIDANNANASADGTFIHFLAISNCISLPLGCLWKLMNIQASSLFLIIQVVIFLKEHSLFMNG